MSDYPTIPLSNYREYPVEEMRRRVQDFYADIDRLRRRGAEILVGPRRLVG